MTQIMKPYDHPALEDATADRRECRVCGNPITGTGPSLRHHGEAVRPKLPNREDALAFSVAFRLAERALGDVLAADASTADLARVAVEALYEAGALNTRRARWRKPLRAA